MSERATGWRRVWRLGLAPQLSDAALEALRRGLQEDDPAITRRVTVIPDPERYPGDAPEQASPLGYALWKGDGLETAEAVYQRVCDLLAGVNRRIGGSPHARGFDWDFLDFWDESPRRVARRGLLEEVEEELARRQRRREGQPRYEPHDPDGTGLRPHPVYDMPPAAPYDYWGAVTDVPCPACGQGTVRWDEAGYVPGHRTCDGCGRHFLAEGDAAAPALVELER